MSSIAPAVAVDRERLIDWYQRNRERSRRLFDILDPEAYYTRPIALRNPIVFYEGHLPAFSVIALLQRGLGLPGVDSRMERLFERGIDPDSVDQAVPRSGAGTIWPSRDEVLAFGRRADEAIVDALGSATFDLSGGEHRAMRRGEAIFTALEHEAMHQETLLYMWHRLPHEQKRAPRGLRYERRRHTAASGLSRFPPARRRSAPTATRCRSAGTTSSARTASTWARSRSTCTTSPTRSISSSSTPAATGRATCGRPPGGSGARTSGHASSVLGSPTAAGGAGAGCSSISASAAWPVYVSQEEAAAFARWRGRRLPTEAEYHRAAFGAPDRPDGMRERQFPWGDAAPDATRGNFDFASWEPVPVGARPLGASAWGVHDLVGNGWEWTSTVFGPFPGFEPMASYPEYSADFFDGQHYVMKGASPATARELVRRSFRNWFRPNYPYVYAKFRTAVS